MKVARYSNKYFHAHMLSKSCGLTLIELVIVCAIIAVLVGLAWTATSFVREKTRQSQCMNNLKQIHLAIVMYRHDWGAITEVPAEGILPHELGLPVDEYSRQLIPYLKTVNVFICPNDYEFPITGAYSYVWHWPPYPYYGNPVLDGCLTLYRQEVRCGERFVLIDCPYHGPKQRTDSFYITLRWNGQVKGHYVKIPITPCWDEP